MIFRNFEGSFPSNVIFCPSLLCFFVCSALMAQTTCLIPFLENDPYSHIDFGQNRLFHLVEIDQWDQELKAIKYYSSTILPLVAEIQDTLFFEVLWRFL